MKKHLIYSLEVIDSSGPDWYVITNPYLFINQFLSWSFHAGIDFSLIFLKSLFILSCYVLISALSVFIFMFYTYKNIFWVCLLRKYVLRLIDMDAGKCIKSLSSICCVIYFCIYSVSIITSLFTIKQLIFKQYMYCFILLYNKLNLWNAFLKSVCLLFLVNPTWFHISSNAVTFTYIKCGLNVQILSGPPYISLALT